MFAQHIPTSWTRSPDVCPEFEFGFDPSKDAIKVAEVDEQLEPYGDRSRFAPGERNTKKTRLDDARRRVKHEKLHRNILIASRSSARVGKTPQNALTRICDNYLRYRFVFGGFGGVVNELGDCATASR